jgi:methyltransferase-like protein
MRKPKKVDRLAYKTIGEETIILDTKLNQQVHQLNELGSFIWNLCDGEHEVSEIIELVCLEFEVSNVVASSDVLEFLEELEQKTLLYDKAL